jgi:ribosomal protein L37AE/L43A
VSDAQRRHRAATSKAMKHRAESRRCPKCGRRSALKRVRLDVYATMSVCRWPDCKYERVVDGMPKKETP